MAASYFFYDLETSGFSPRSARIMQFAGQRTDMDLKPIGEPVNLLIKLTPDVLPSPDAIMVTGITPQLTLADGLTEAEFLQYFYEEIVKPDTIFMGYNSVRFDDEFMRFMHYRNYYDAYEWQWKDACSRWDLLDVVRMTRALRPEGIVWPFTDDGKPTNRLELLTAANGLDHDHAHDALSDVSATIAVAKLVKDKQPELFKYLLDCRQKKVVKDIVLKGAPFVYTSGRYAGQYLHTTAAVLLSVHPEQDAALVYDLRFDPTPFIGMSVDELVAAWQYSKDPEAVRLPVKTLKYNRCPAVAPLGVMKDAATQERLQLSLSTVTKHLEILKKNHKTFVEKLHETIKRLDTVRTTGDKSGQHLAIDERLYDGFISPADTDLMRAVRQAAPDDLPALTERFKDARLRDMLPLYKARNFPRQLSSEERAVWEDYLHKKLLSGGKDSELARYFNRLQELAAANPTPEQQYLLEELQLYGESIVPADTSDQS